MGLWEFILYGVTAFLALRSLSSLMLSHQQQFRTELIVELQAELDASLHQSPSAKKTTNEQANLPRAA